MAIHDVAPETWRACARLVGAVRAVVPIPLTLLVVPDYHARNARVDAWYRAALDAHVAHGDELALHGYYHRDDASPPRALTDRLRRRIYTAGEGEFAALPEMAARARLLRGQEWFRRHGWPLAGFVPPAWLLSPGGARAVRALGFHYMTTLGAFHVFEPEITLRAPCLTWSTRSNTRRCLARVWNHTLAQVTRDAAVVRVALHPGDALYPDILAQAQRLVALLCCERRPLTKMALAGALRHAQDGRQTTENRGWTD